MQTNTIARAVLIGAGNVATHLGKALQAADVEVLQVYSRSGSSARVLAQQLGCRFTDRIDSLANTGDIYIMSVADDAIADVAARFPLKDRLLVHTSGSIAMEALQTGSTRYGVLYPLQTFSRDVPVDFSQVPLCLESKMSGDRKLLGALAEKLSGTVVWIDSRQRRSLHAAAVFACNFVNHMYTAAADILKEHDLSFDLLRPLIGETARKAMQGHPASVQTGPARRNDKHVLEKHAELLEQHPELRKLYIFISESIIGRYHR